MATLLGLMLVTFACVHLPSKLVDALSTLALFAKPYSLANQDR